MLIETTSKRVAPRWCDPLIRSRLRRCLQHEPCMVTACRHRDGTLTVEVTQGGPSPLRNLLETRDVLAVWQVDLPTPRVWDDLHAQELAEELDGRRWRYVDVT